MFLDFYRLREQPFGVTPDPRFLYLSPTHREALASLFYGVETGRGFVTLIAKPGTGKTTLLLQLLERLRKSACAAFLFQTQCNSRELLQYLLSEMGFDDYGEDMVRLHRKLNQALLRIKDAGMRFVLIIDEAQNLEPTALEMVRLLSNFEYSRSKLLQIVLAGQPQLAQKLASPALLQLRQRISILTRLNPLSPAETNWYIDHRLRIAGYCGDSLFTPEALALIAAGSQGIPRNINTLCFNALSLGYAGGRKTIDAQIVQEAATDLELNILVSETPSDTSTVEPEEAPLFHYRPVGSDGLGRQIATAALGTFLLLTCFALAHHAKGLGRLLRSGTVGLLKKPLLIGGMRMLKTEAANLRAKVPAATESASSYWSSSAEFEVRLPQGADGQGSLQGGLVNAVVAPASANLAPPVDSQRDHVLSVAVKPQDTLWRISLRYVGQQNWSVVNEICGLNPRISDPNRIIAGQRIRIPTPARKGHGRILGRP